MRRFARPSPGLVIAVLALFVALGGVAGAAVTAAVPLAKRALVADNAKKLSGLTAVQLGGAILKASSQMPGPASTAAGVVTYKTTSASLGANQGQDFQVPCDPGQKVIGGGFSSDGDVYNLDSFPRDASVWDLYLVNGDQSDHPVNLYAVCIK